MVASLALRKPSPRALAIGAIGSCAIVAIWALSRTIGLPLTLTVWQREPLEGIDFLTSVDEIVAALLIARIVGFGTARAEPLTTSSLRNVSILVGVLVMTTLFMPMIAGHQHA
jgi:hypothetical protein